MGDRKVTTFSWPVRKDTIQDKTGKQSWIEPSAFSSPRAVTSRKKNKSKGTEVGVCLAFVKKWLAGQCDWDRMREVW